MPIVDLRFRLIGTLIPADHSYQLASAIARHIPAFHADGEVGIHAIRGTIAPQRRLRLSPASQLVIRICSDRIADALPLVDASLTIGDYAIRIGVPEIHP